MPIPNTKVFLSAALSSGGAYRFLPEVTGDFAQTFTENSVPAWVASIGDLNGDGIPEIIMGAPGSDDKALNAGRIFVVFGQTTGGTTQTIGDIAMATRLVSIDGLNAGDLAGSSVGSISDLNGDGRGEILVGAPKMEKGAAIDAGAGFVLWGPSVAGGIDLGDPFAGAGNGKGYAIKGQAAGDNAGASIASIPDLNGDGKPEVAIGAPGNDGNGADSGAVYIVFGKNTDTVVQLSSVATGTGGFKIVGEDNGDAIGLAFSAIDDLNGDGKAEILIGAPNNVLGGTNMGAAYVVYGKATGTPVQLTNIANGIGGFKITGQVDDEAGTSITGLGDVNGDGLADMLVGAPRADRAYVVFGKSNTTNIDLTNVVAGIGGYSILAQNLGDFDKLSVTGGVDFNRDGIKDLAIGVPDNNEGGSHVGAVYVVWGGGTGTIDLNLVAQGIGGAKIVGIAGSYFGSSVAIVGDQNGDGTSELLIGSNDIGGESASVLFAPTSWQPDHNIYGTAGNDTMGFGFGGSHKIDDTANSILGLAGNDTIAGAGGDDSLEGSAGNDSLNGDTGNDLLDGGTGTDTMNGGTGDDLFVVDSTLDAVQENFNEGIDTVKLSINFTIGNNIENLLLTVGGIIGIGNALDNTLTGSNGNETLNGASGNDTLNANTGNDSLDGGSGNDSMSGGVGNNIYVVNTIGDVVREDLNVGTDTVQSSIDYTLDNNVENLTLGGSATQGIGNAIANVIIGSANNDKLFGMNGNDILNSNGGNDTLDGGTEADLMTGGTGDDIYYIDNAGDAAVESLGGGTDTINSNIDRTLEANVENLILTGSAIYGTGNTLNNFLTGTVGDNVLDGSVGVDTMVGGDGNDIYVIDSANDVVQEIANVGSGIDTVQSNIDYTLGINIENLTLIVAGHIGTGNTLNNILTGTSGKDTLDGAVGNDTMSGGTGDDIYRIDSLNDLVQESTDTGTDTIFAYIDGIALAGNVENLTLVGTAHSATGNELDNIMTGDANNDSLSSGLGNDIIDGSAGSDTMTGGGGDDTYYIDNPDDVVNEDLGGGSDTVVVNSDWTVGNNIENIRLTGTGHTATGNAENNTLSGGNGDDIFDGVGGDDMEIGNDGNDVLICTSGRDTLVGGSGNDKFKIHGGSARIEDFLGHDTIDASDSNTDDSIDLSGETESEIEQEICDIGNGGQTAHKLDVQFLQDLSDSFTDDLPNVKTLVSQIVNAIRSIQTDSKFGSSTFIDKPISPFGAAGE
jgi:Ca2+-binding RTX toxin-like protein